MGENMSRQYSNHLILLIFLTGLMLLMPSCGGGGGGGSSVADTVPPVTTASVGAGLYGSVQSVTLTSNEASTIHYSVDGVDPAVGAQNTTSQSSPISGITIGAGTTILKFFAIDTAGNREAISSITYMVDVASPTITLISTAPPAFGLLTSCTLTWQSDEPGNYVVELGGTGTKGTGTVLTSGNIAANAPFAHSVNGYQLSFSAPTPLWVYVTDAVGHTGSTSLSLSMKPLANIPIGGELRKIAILPNGQKAYVARTDANGVDVVDTNPLSAAYNTVLKTVATGTRPHGLAITPDGSRVYVTNNGETSLDIDSIAVVSTSTDSIITKVPLGSNSAPTGIALTTDGKRGYFLSFDQVVYILDTNPASATYNTVIGNIPRIQLLMGNITMTPDGEKAVVNWQGSIAHAVEVIDVDPLSPTLDTIVATPIPVVSGLGAEVAVSPDSAYAYATNSSNQLCKIDLQSYAVSAFNASMITDGAIAVTPDGKTLLSSSYNSPNLFVFTTSDMSSIVQLNLGANLGQYIAITPDGTRAYIERNVLFVNSELIMVPLQ